ncbi:MAG TPA: phage tail tape measure protein [Candidatus Paceibacterota bacterium]
MTSIIADLVVNLIGNDTALIAATKRSITALEKNATVADSVRASMEKMGKGSALALTAIAAYSIKSATDFQANMELIKTQAHESQSTVDGLSKSVLNLAPTVGVGPNELAKGLYHVASAAAGTGMSAATMMDILTNSAKTAQMGLSDMESTSTALVGTMVTGMKDVHGAADAVSYLNTIVGMGNIRMQDLVNAIGTGALPAFKSAGMGMRDFGASLTLLTDMGEPATQVATRLRTSIVMMTHETPAADKQLAKIGLSTKKLAEDLNSPGGMLKAITDLRDHMKGLSQPDQNRILEGAFGGARTGSTIEALVQNVDRLGAKYKMFGTEASRAKTMQDGWNATQNTARQKMHELGASLQVMAIQFGQKLLPIVSKFIDFLTHHQTTMKAFFAIIIIGLALMTAAWLAMSLSMMANPVFWIIAGIVAAIMLLAFGIYELVKHWKTVWKWIKDIAEDVWQWLVHAWKATWNTIKGVVSWIYNNIIKPVADFFMKYIYAPIKWYLTLASNFWKFVWGFMSVIFADFMRDVRAIWHWFDGIINTVKGWLISFYTWIDNTFGKPLRKLFSDLMEGAKVEWAKIENIIEWVKGKLDKFYGWIDGTFIKPIKGLFNDFKVGWDALWNGAHKTFSAIWDKLKPIFDFVSNAINKVIGLFKDVGNAFSKDPIGLGKAVAHVFGFEKGGTVPGAIGAPTLILAHGGEVVLPNTVTSSIRSGQPINVQGMSPGALAASSAGMGSQAAINEFRFFIGPRELRDFSVQELQRRKIRNAATGAT